MTVVRTRRVVVPSCSIEALGSADGFGQSCHEVRCSSEHHDSTQRPEFCSGNFKMPRLPLLSHVPHTQFQPLWSSGQMSPWLTLVYCSVEAASLPLQSVIGGLPCVPASTIGRPILVQVPAFQRDRRRRTQHCESRLTKIQ